MHMNHTRVKRASGKSAILHARLSLRSQPQLIGARSFHDEHGDGVRFPLRPTRDNTNKWAIRPNDIPRHHFICLDRRLFDLADLVKWNFLAWPEEARDVDDPIFVISFHVDRTEIGFRELPKHLVLALVSFDVLHLLFRSM